MEQQRNWAGNYTYGASEIHIPDSLEQVQDLVARSERLKVLGTRHSFNDIADTTGAHVSLQKLSRVIALDRVRNTVTVEAGIRYGDLCAYLQDNGRALHNLASLPHITVAGACASATHGSGVRNGNLATAVRSLEVVQGNGETVVFSRGDEDGRFDGAAVGLGGLGVVTKLTLDVVPAFEMTQQVYEDLPLAQLESNAEAILAGGYSVSLFTDWKQPAFNQVWVKTKHAGDADAGVLPELFGAKPARENLHPVPGHSAENCSEQLGVPGPWHERLPHFRMAFTPSAGEELQSEYFVPRERAYEALLAIDRLRDAISPLLYTSEVRTIAADGFWMSPCYRQDSVAIHFTWKPEWAAVQAVLPLIEEGLAPFGARPHWAKLFTMAPARVQSLYEKRPEFVRLLEDSDPNGKFRNGFLLKYIAENAV
ncbi:FAD-binding protein [Paenibacillus glycinis]|uniref:FAD-binding protein n=1 Tax=Paenibacillus glycinis TaxID=2697035 RepID=A0ABW9XKV9_9BACL|nr:FAD-binding protein [Paenibacillus glycinis]NBD23196.1 FAD-binding protein [Paenibacillus glycinis]